MLIEAVKSLSPNTVTTRPQGTDVELPLFTRGQVWPQLPYLPTPDQLSRPPQYVADLLVKLYFDQLHYTFPVVFKPHFKQRYRALYRNGSGGSDRRFLLVFFAVCACASSLFPSTSNARFPGLEYYEKALLLYYASTGEASLEKVQCLALLAVCSAGWNTITQSWILAGQAVRASEDIGLHLSSRLVRPLPLILILLMSRSRLSLAPQPPKAPTSSASKYPNESGGASTALTGTPPVLD